MPGLCSVHVRVLCDMYILCNADRRRFPQAFAKQFNMAPDDLDMHVIYDVSHNIAKVEEHFIDGKQKTLLVHRKVSGQRCGPAGRPPPPASGGTCTRTGAPGCHARGSHFI